MHVCIFLFLDLYWELTGNILADGVSSWFKDFQSSLFPLTRRYFAQICSHIMGESLHEGQFAPMLFRALFSAFPFHTSFEQRKTLLVYDYFTCSAVHSGPAACAGTVVAIHCINARASILTRVAGTLVNV